MNLVTHDALLEKLSAALLQEFPQDKDLWIEHIRFLRVNDVQLSVRVPNTLYKERFDECYAASVQKCLLVHAPEVRDVEVAVDSADNAPAENPLLQIVDSQKALNNKNAAQLHNSFALSLNPKYTFDRLVVGNHNRLAHAAALKITECPAYEYNPLFVYGGVGLGKTHLMQAIGHGLQSEKLLEIVYVTSEQFTNDFIYSLQKNRTHAFRLKYRYADLLLVDDVQFFEGKAKIQEELFHTFNMLKESGKQMVFTSDRSPKKLKTIMDRLVSRFASGLVTHVTRPDIAFRKRILQKRFTEHHLEVPEEVVHFLASCDTQNIRDLEACVLKVKSLAVLLKQKITLPLVTEHLHDFFPEQDFPHEPLSIGTIQREVAKYYHLSHDSLISKSRTGAIAKARQIAIYLAKELTSLSTTQLGYEFGGRNHSTVLSSYHKIEKQIKQNPHIRYDIDSLKQRFLQI